MKADKGNCFVVMDRKEYDEKMNNLLSDEKTYQKEKKATIQKDRTGTKHKTSYSKNPRKIRWKDLQKTTLHRRFTTYNKRIGEANQAREQANSYRQISRLQFPPRAET